MLFSGHFLEASWKFAVRQVGSRLGSAPISADLESRTYLETSRKDAGDLLPSWLAGRIILPGNFQEGLPGRMLSAWKLPGENGMLSIIGWLDKGADGVSWRIWWTDSWMSG